MRLPSDRVDHWTSARHGSRDRKYASKGNPARGPHPVRRLASNHAAPLYHHLPPPLCHRLAVPSATQWVAPGHWGARSGDARLAAGRGRGRGGGGRSHRGSRSTAGGRAEDRGWPEHSGRSGATGSGPRGSGASAPRGACCRPRGNAGARGRPGTLRLGRRDSATSHGTAAGRRCRPARCCDRRP
jgi:hypothetical protein